ncbi:MAG: YceI family protein [Bacteroidota bacterium]
MNYKNITFSLCLNVILLGYSQKNGDFEKLDINVEKSNIHWIGQYLFYFGGHDGNISFKDGYFIKSNEVISGGEFVIDMNSMTNLDIDDPDGKESLIEHLMDPDFFGVANNPTAKLVIKSVEYQDANSMKFYADLTIKGITNPIAFNATANYEKETLEARFKIDRMLWDVSYNSKLRDGAISDAIGFEVLISL